MSRHPDVTVVGSINQDMVARVPRLPGPGQTVLGHELVIVPGGKGLNQAVAAARSGASTAFVGLVGEDSAGTYLLAVLGDEGIDTRGVATVGALTGRALIAVADDGENHIVVVPGANWVGQRRPHVEHHRPRIESAHASSWPSSRSRSTRSRRRCGGPGRPAPGPSSTPRRRWSWRRSWSGSSTSSIVNEHEAAAMAGQAGDAPRPRRRRPAGRCRPGLRGGRRDARVRGRGAGERAGDASTSPPSRSRRSTRPRPATPSRVGSPPAWPTAPAWPEALRWAVAAGALAVTSLGAAPSIPLRADVERMLAVRPDRPLMAAWQVRAPARSTSAA